MQTIGNYEAKIGAPVLLTLVFLTLIPSTPGYIDCRISCRRCHENTEHPAVLEVYCAMCEECKQRRRERMQGRTPKGKVNPSPKPTLKPLTKLTKPKQLVRMRDGVEANANDDAMVRPQDNVQFQQVEQDAPAQPQQPFELQQQVLSPPQPPPERQPPRPSYKPQKLLRGNEYPVGCPTPPFCSDSDYEDEQVEPTKPEPKTTTTTTTTTRRPCPPMPKCRKKRKPKPTPAACMNPCMVPPSYMCPCPMFPAPMKPYAPGDYTEHFPPGYPKPMPYPYMPPMFPPNPYVPNMFPPPIFVPVNGQWPGWMSTTAKPHEEKELTPQVETTNDTAKNDEFFYLHVGLPVQNIS